MICYNNYPFIAMCDLFTGQNGPKRIYDSYTKVMVNGTRFLAVPAAIKCKKGKYQANIINYFSNPCTKQ